MKMLGNRRRIIVAALAASVALAGGGSATATPVSTSLAELGAPVSNHIVTARSVPARWQRVRVPAGILAGVPTGSIPGGARLRTVYPPYPVGFSADPYFSPPAVVVVPPPLVFAPPPLFAPSPLLLAPPLLYGSAPLWLPFDGDCFVPSDNVGLHGYFGACADAFYQQWASRPG